MKLGMILECGPDGPDVKVCRRLIDGWLCPILRLEIEHAPPATMVNKGELLRDCGRVARRFLDPAGADGCDQVLIVWDLHPGAGLAADRALILESLQNAGVPLDRVLLVCIERELETWLLADSRALTSLVRTLTGRQNVTVPRVRDPHRFADPKSHLDGLFREYSKRPYRDYEYAHRIIDELTDLRELVKICTFLRLAAKLSGRTRDDVRARLRSGRA
jgi:hypothetical protein